MLNANQIWNLAYEEGTEAVHELAKQLGVDKAKFSKNKDYVQAIAAASTAEQNGVIAFLKRMGINANDWVNNNELMLEVIRYMVMNRRFIDQAELDSALDKVIVPLVRKVVDLERRIADMESPKAEIDLIGGKAQKAESAIKINLLDDEPDTPLPIRIIEERPAKKEASGWDQLVAAYNKAKK